MPASTYGGLQPQALTMPLEVLDGTLVLLCLGPRREGPEVAAFARLRIDLPRIQAALPGLERADHDRLRRPGP